ncbi:MAG: hypothetical protein QM627_01685 [Luteolibacter sp.]
MKSPLRPRRNRGYVSLVLVVTTLSLLLMLMIYAYKRSVASMNTQKIVQLKVDYNEKEEAMLRYLVANVPNRAIRAMQGGSNAAGTDLTWEALFTESLTAGNARQSISPGLVAAMGAADARRADTGDSTLGTDVSRIFSAVNGEAGLVSSGLNRTLGAGFPVALNSTDATTNARDSLYPIISSHKKYGALASGRVGRATGDYPDHNVLVYPRINFGYGTPGQPFVAKRNWWAFNINLAANDEAATSVRSAPRQFVCSVYEVPSQLAISAASHMSLGNWGPNVEVRGNVFAGRADVEGDISLDGLASRRSSVLAAGATIGGQALTGNVFTPGVRENYQLTTGNFFPVSQASESGKVAFVPINRGTDFFDAYSVPDAELSYSNGSETLPPQVASLEGNAVSTQTWNSYSIGALQASMRLDVVRCVSTGGQQKHTSPTKVLFQYKTAGNVSRSVWMPIEGVVWEGNLANIGFNTAGVATENGSVNVGSALVDVAYGMNGRYYIKRNQSGVVRFDNATFGDPIVGTVKAGYIARARNFFDVSNTVLRKENSVDEYKPCIMVYPERIAAFLNVIGAAAPSVNHSIAVNVNYKNSWMGPTYPPAPSNVNPDDQYGVVIGEADDLTAFTKGFSLVTNLRLYIADDFNTQSMTPPTGYGGTLPYYPPCSLFAPEKRYGLVTDPLAIELTGQVGSVAHDTDDAVRPLDSKNRSGNTIAASNMNVNLRPITDPADLPPITMMNWLILLEEKTNQF